MFSTRGMGGRVEVTEVVVPLSPRQLITVSIISFPDISLVTLPPSALGVFFNIQHPKNQEQTKFYLQIREMKNEKRGRDPPKLNLLSWIGLGKEIGKKKTAETSVFYLE